MTVPLLRPSIAAGCLLVALYTLSDFGAVSLLQYDSLTRAIYLQYQGSLDRSMAALLALVLVALTAVILLAEGASRGRARYYRFARTTERPGHYRLRTLDSAGARASAPRRRCRPSSCQPPSCCTGSAAGSRRRRSASIRCGCRC